MWLIDYINYAFATASNLCSTKHDTHRNSPKVHKRGVCVFFSVPKFGALLFLIFLTTLRLGGNPYEWNPYCNRRIKDPTINVPIKIYGYVSPKLVTV